MEVKLQRDGLMAKLVSAQEFADRLGISLRMFEAMIVQGKIPGHIKLGRLRRWHPEQVEHWINEQFAKANGESASAQERTNGPGI